MKHEVQEKIKKQLNKLTANDSATFAFRKGNTLYLNGQSQVLSQSKNQFELAVDDEFDDFNVSISINGEVETKCNCKSKEWCQHKIASLLQVSETLARFDGDGKPTGKAYTRKGMIKRVLEERWDKARKADYHLEFADNIYGEHLLTNERGITYKLTFRDTEKQTGYCSCPDYQQNKLGTCKHLLFAFEKFKKLKQKNKKARKYPFVEIFLDPLNDYKISWYYPDTLPQGIAQLIEKYFGKEKVLDESKVKTFLSFVQDAEAFKKILIRPEVLDKIEDTFNQKIIEQVRQSTKPDYSVLNAELYPYQKEGIAFAAYRKGAIIADEMGLGKTIQAIGAALLKRKLFGFNKTLIICPASLKSQWKSEIEKFSDAKAVVVEGTPYEREKIYRESDAFFQIINYETVLRDKNALNKGAFDYIILDEAQRIKNFETITAAAIKSLSKKHALVITGTPIENKLIDLYSIVEFIDPKMLTPLWEFSYQHCYFDHDHKNKITGYYNLQELKERMKPVLIRREKQDVIDQLNEVSQVDVPVEMHDQQREYHASSAQAIASILRKKFKTPFDMQRLTMHLQTMRMACDSSYLVDKKSNHSPKLIELKDILLEKFDLKNNKRKIIIFSEWKRMNHIIGKMLSENGLAYAELSGDVPVKNRKKLISEFENNPDCRVFLSTEAGGSGLNLQVADTVINFELPWNPAKKNQRIGRIDRIGQKNKNLTVINLITRGSIEMKIASGLVVKQNLFDSVLSPGNSEDVVDFSDKGRAQFLKQLEEALSDFAPEADALESDAPQLASEVDKFAEAKESEQSSDQTKQQERIKQLEELEQVMNRGMEFFAGMYKMTTGKELAAENNKLEVDKETGEVVMRFKMPV